MATVHNKTNFRIMRLCGEIRGFRHVADEADRAILNEVLSKLDEVLDLAAKLRKPGQPKK